MGSIELFSDNTYFVITLFSLILLLFATIYAARSERLAAPLWLLLAALGVDYLAGGVAALGADVYNQGGAITAYVFVELLLLLISMLFMLLAGSQLLIRALPNNFITLAVALLGFVAVAIFVLFLPDGLMVANMRIIFPLAGFAILAVAFWSNLRIRYNGGFILAALVASSVVLFLALRLLGVEFAFGRFSWAVPAVTYILLSLAFVMLRGDTIAAKLSKTEAEVEKYNRRIEDIIKSSPFPIIISRLSDDRLILANNNAVKLFGINPAELERYRLKDFFADADNRQLLNERLENEREVQDFEILVKTPLSDAPFWLLASANVIDYNYDVALYSAYQDITSRKNREALLKNQATRDPLTSLYNRRYFEDEVSRQILQAKAGGNPYSVLMIDADKFKNVNDTYGHKTGDKVLIELASTAERALRDKDIVARYGGEEFVVFLPNIAADQARGVADRLRESISTVIVHSDNNQPVSFTVSIGVSSSAISDNIDTLIKTADEALYRAKQNGRNRVEVFTKEDLRKFMDLGQVEHKDESHNHHPVFDKENASEISLLDGIETGKIEGEPTIIETAGNIKED